MINSKGTKSIKMGSILKLGRSSGEGIGFWASLVAQLVKNLPAM